jgi:hypothetical protein
MDAYVSGGADRASACSIAMSDDEGYSDNEGPQPSTSAIAFTMPSNFPPASGLSVDVSRMSATERAGNVAASLVVCCYPYYRYLLDLALHLLASLNTMQLGEIHRRVLPMLQMDIVSVRSKL